MSSEGVAIFIIVVLVSILVFLINSSGKHTESLKLELFNTKNETDNYIKHLLQTIENLHYEKESLSKRVEELESELDALTCSAADVNLESADSINELKEGVEDSDTETLVGVLTSIAAAPDQTIPETLVSTEDQLTATSAPNVSGAPIIFNEEQRSIIFAPRGNMLVLAAAGTGKTTVVIHRIKHLIDAYKLPKYSILAITFSKKAALEMSTRIKNVGYSGVTVKTFHGFCINFLRDNEDISGLLAGFKILRKRENTIRNLIGKAKIRLPQNERILISDIPTDYIEYISNKKREGISPVLPDEFDSESTTEQIRNMVYFLYQEHLRSNNAIDYDEMIFRTYNILKHQENIRAKYNQRYKEIIVDEFQDTDYLQYEIVKYLSHSPDTHVMVVGDDDQSIYAWRGADVANILCFPEYFENTMVMKLQQNYRSSPAIIKLANNIIQRNKNRSEKQMFTDKVEGEDVICITHDVSAEKEVKIVSDYIGECIDKFHKSPDTCAVLSRFSDNLYAIQKELKSRGIPTHLKHGNNTLNDKNVKTVLYLTDITPESNLLLVIDMLNSAYKIHIPSEYRNKLQAKISACHPMEFLHFDEKGLGGNNIPILNRMVDNVFKYIHAINRERLNVYAKLSLAINIFSDVEESTQFFSTEEVSEIIVYAKFFCEEMTAEYDTYKLSDFQDYLSSSEKAENQDISGKVKLMTIHTSKGAEFDCVAITKFGDCHKDAELEEERRVYYVAVTRAKERLLLTRSLTPTSNRRNILEVDKDLFTPPTNEQEEFLVTKLGNQQAPFTERKMVAPSLENTAQVEDTHPTGIPTPAPTSTTTPKTKRIPSLWIEPYVPEISESIEELINEFKDTTPPPVPPTPVITTSLHESSHHKELPVDKFKAIANLLPEAFLIHDELNIIYNGMYHSPRISRITRVKNDCEFCTDDGVRFLLKNVTITRVYIRADLYAEYIDLRAQIARDSAGDPRAPTTHLKYSGYYNAHNYEDPDYESAEGRSPYTWGDIDADDP